MCGQPSHTFLLWLSPGLRGGAAPAGKAQDGEKARGAFQNRARCAAGRTSPTAVAGGHVGRGGGNPLVSCSLGSGAAADGPALTAGVWLPLPCCPRCCRSVSVCRVRVCITGSCLHCSLAFPFPSRFCQPEGRWEGRGQPRGGTGYFPPPLLPGLSGGAFAVPAALTPAGRPSLRAAGWSGLQRVRVPAPCSCGGLLLSLVPSPLSIHRLSSPLLHGLCAQFAILNHPHSKDLERLLFPGRPSWLGGSYSKTADLGGPVVTSPSRGGGRFGPSEAV